MKKIYTLFLTLAMGASMASFAAEIPANSKCYDGSTPGSLVVDMGGGDELGGKGVGNVYITPIGDGKVDFLLPDLNLGELSAGESIGDIEVKNVETTTLADGTVVYNATVPDMSLLGGYIHAKVVLANGDGKSCTTNSKGEAHFDINVIWYMDYPENTQEMPIYVTFNGQLKSSEISNLNADADSAATYFDLQGNSINADALVSGQTYIKRQGTKTTKVIVL